MALTVFDWLIWIARYFPTFLFLSSFPPSLPSPSQYVPIGDAVVQSALNSWSSWKQLGAVVVMTISLYLLKWKRFHVNSWVVFRLKGFYYFIFWIANLLHILSMSAQNGHSPVPYDHIVTCLPNEHNDILARSFCNTFNGSHYGQGHVITCGVGQRAIWLLLIQYLADITTFGGLGSVALVIQTYRFITVYYADEIFSWTGKSGDVLCCR